MGLSKSFLTKVVITSALLSGNGYASCFGTPNMYTCNDLNTGNTYNVQKFGGSTYMQGSNPNTGSNWSQNSHTFGNTTQIYGNTNGNSWNQTITPHNVYGTDSKGNSYNYQRRNGW